MFVVLDSFTFQLVMQVELHLLEGLERSVDYVSDIVGKERGRKEEA